jgi:hypothetical protein
LLDDEALLGFRMVIRSWPNFQSGSGDSISAARSSELKAIMDPRALCPFLMFLISPRLRSLQALNSRSCPALSFKYVLAKEDANLRGYRSTCVSATGRLEMVSSLVVFAIHKTPVSQSCINTLYWNFGWGRSLRLLVLLCSRYNSSLNSACPFFKPFS